MTADDKKFAFSVKTDDWDHYARYRPSYPESMWTTWLDFHQGPLESIMDVGTGGGIGAASFLAVASSRGQQVNRVYLSDPNENNLAAAKKNFTSERYPGIQFFFHRGPAEEAFPGLSPGSVDMLIACASIHWTEIDTAMSTIADTLRPGGTFGAVVYPQPTIKDDEQAADALAAVFEKRRRFQDQGDAEKDVTKSVRARAFRNLSIGLDYVPFDPSKWATVHRRTANLPKDGKWPLRDSTWAHYGEPKLAVLKGEQVEVVEEDEWWSRKGYSIEQLKEFFQTLGYEPFVMDGRLWETDAFSQFEKLVRERGGDFELVWPAATVLGRKK
ncbi:S-adenosyl-L-methionine-dependent methyltransferase [Cryphonectria parasitica EP155]|uniref:S-adenosyl-L-methionine-dependent methyltransferase n=1 Tax=Cryphonectria parasitica (strain ATCC 38755 / EP155) TaxID=660469 RepID=A0A9P4Y197_CRYP1|nr:S-adenosyl-L-methionine-dependent methyltransferase [Cryphonectria parasitica EP155]KAF3764669.1 S-adenosyl-L-methionine-dependent methyltransferase [Cryphonectria parasitica EP155]